MVDIQTLDPAHNRMEVAPLEMVEGINIQDLPLSSQVDLLQELTEAGSKTLGPTLNLMAEVYQEMEVVTSIHDQVLSLMEEGHRVDQEVVTQHPVNRQMDCPHLRLEHPVNHLLDRALNRVVSHLLVMGFPLNQPLDPALSQVVSPLEAIRVTIIRGPLNLVML